MPANFMYKLLCRRPIKHVLERIPYVRRVYSGWTRVHPFDVQYGTDTSGYVAVEDITSDASLRGKINSYAASQPAIVRKVLSKIPDPQNYTFIDLGCGKGRAAIVASEFAFENIVGIELSGDLCRVAEANAATVKARYPERTPIRIIEGNAVKFDFPSKKLVIYLCHSFGPELVGELIKTIEEGVKSSAVEELFFVYYNPVHGDLFDASKTMQRWFADIVPYDESEIGYGPDLEDTVVIWHSVPATRRERVPAPHPRADRPIIIHKRMWTAGLAQYVVAASVHTAELVETPLLLVF